MGRRAILLAAMGAYAATHGVAMEVQLGALIGEGTYGAVYRATVRGSAPAVAKRALVGVEHAAEYLETEEALNAVVARALPGSPHFAPYLGAADVGGEHYLLWGESGTHSLRELLARGDVGLVALAEQLGIAPSDRAELMREVLRQLLECLSQVHACGIVHRDIKPENILLDPATRSLRLIDFGSACEMKGGWPFARKRGYRPDRGPCSVLYCPPEELIDEGAPYAYDVYSAALVWLRCIMPALQGEDDAALADFRHDLARAGDRLDGWLGAWLAGGAIVRPDEASAWARGLELFDGGVDGRLAWRLLRAMMEPDARKRAGASEALAGPYLGRSCAGPGRGGEAAAAAAGAAAGAADDEDAPQCYVDDYDPPSILHAVLRGRQAEPAGLVAVELRPPLGLLLEEDDDAARARRAHLLREQPEEGARARQRSRAAAAAEVLTGERGVMVASVLDGGSASASGLVSAGDELVAVGPFDVSELGLDAVIGLLSRWSAPTVRLCFRRAEGRAGADGADRPA